MRKEVKELYMNNTIASVRDYEVEQCIQRNENMEITHGGEKMTLTPEDLKTKRETMSPKFISKVGGKDYHLFGYSWEPDNVEL